MNKIENLEGIGSKTSELFHKINIYTIEDLIEYYPRKYEIIKRSNLKTLKDGDKIIIDGIVESAPIISSVNRKLKKILFRISTNNMIFNITVFNQTYLYHKLMVGMKVIIIGKYNRLKNIIVASEVNEGVLPPTSQVQSIYHATSDLSQKTIKKFIDLALKTNIDIKDNIPETIRKKYSFPDKKICIIEMHHPTSTIHFKKALQRLKYEEFFEYLYNIHMIKQKRKETENALQKEFSTKSVENLIKTLPFSLTEDQIKTIKEIENDMKKKIRMNRLIQGDVGSGKTIVALIASYMNYLAGYQTAFMVPTEILATQHYQTAINLLKPFGMKISILTSTTTKKDKEKIYKQIKNHEIDLIIGTQSLIQEKVKYTKLGLIITDEQHRFGVHQREELKNKGTFPDVLSMSATPIPRTYALTIYGDMDVSNIKTKPSGRKQVITYAKKMDEIKEVLILMKKEIELGHQIYVIAPSIEAEDNNELNSINILTEKMNLAFGKIAKIGTIHGKLSPEEKNKTMNAFETGKTKILISTTVIEVGVNVPNASMIVIFHANYFGLSTLHQLRGRVGRGTIQSYCILISKENQSRLKMLETCNDGFKISEYDFKTRGEGDLFGTKQSGEATFKLANIKHDFELLVRTKEDVENYYKTAKN